MKKPPSKLRRMYNRLVWLYLPPCRDVVRVLSASMDRKLTFRERIVARLHLAACRPCVRYMEQSEQLRVMIGEIRENECTEVVPELADDSRERIKTALASFAYVCAVVSVMPLVL